MRHRSHLCACVVLVSGMALLAGCGPSDGPAPGSPAAQRMVMSPEQKKQAMIQDIENNPKMPPFAKQMAINNLNSAADRK